MFEKPKNPVHLLFLYTTKCQEKWSLSKNCSICKIKTYRKLKRVLSFCFLVRTTYFYEKTEVQII